MQQGARCRTKDVRASLTMTLCSTSPKGSMPVSRRFAAPTERPDYLIDEVTGTLRRGPGLRELQHEIDRTRRQGGPMVVAFIDVDGLKAVNDKRGHAAGDQLLRDVAEALKQGLRSYDLVLR